MVNLMQLAIDVLPSGGWGDLLLAKADDYSGDMGGASTKRYILIGLILLSMAVFLRRKGLFDDTSRRGNIVLLYVLIMFLNYNNSNAFYPVCQFLFVRRHFGVSGIAEAQEGEVDVVRLYGGVHDVEFANDLWTDAFRRLLFELYG